MLRYSLSSLNKILTPKNYKLINNNGNILYYYSSKVTLLDGRQIEFPEYKNSVEIMNHLSKSLSKTSLISRINGKELKSLQEVIKKEEYKIEFLDFEDRDARLSFWKSSSNLLALAIKNHYQSTSKNKWTELEIVQFGHMISTDIGQQENLNLGTFFVDVYFPDGNTLKETDIKEIVIEMETLIKQNQQNNNSNKLVESIIKLQSDIPLVQTSSIKFFEVIKNSSVIGIGSSDNYSTGLQRLIGISFPDEIRYKEWKEQQRLAALRDHRNIGRDQELFFFHPYSPGSSFFLPHGTRIYNKLLDFLKDQYRKRGYHEVMSPNIYNQKLWETSGHWQNYKDNMFTFKCDHTEYSLKPMNCPGHCLMFGHRTRSYKELPLRLADFGALHRNEAHGALSGLTRVRRFQQDDAHIFCTHEQIRSEIKSCLEFMKYVYDIFGFTFRLELSTRPEPFMGELEQWEQAELSLKELLNEFCGDKWTLNPGDGAFYGPKIDIHLQDANGKSFQCATIQLDFQLPQRFQLTYQSAESDNVNNNSNTTTTTSPVELLKTPVMIHRAIFGSVERMLAILMEHTGGKWPFWLSPRQAMVIPVNSKFNDYALAVQKQLLTDKQQFYVDVELSDQKSFSKKIRDATIQHYNYLIIVGQDELSNQTITVRKRSDQDKQIKSTVNQLLSEFNDQINQFK
ncbi:threonyl-tRNA synthetase [Tieghemostelium lacteum]|uniref:threonine--tRNA ligase n=1 Tax=Tieghemostelium lacteum TaxID=361077 RepID=A0A152A530_TIELA|nr:threonyl-tRNA synthetase [Tieghemostelium lacteum]|eukprot:KYR01340.1 threonyl-tRNA synthetase [Tieghemostelium lacteum]